GYRQKCLCSHYVTHETNNPPDGSSGHLPFVRPLCFELGLFGRSSQCCGGRLPAFDSLCDSIEIASTHLTLMLDSGKAQFSRRKFFLLQFNESTHLATGITMCQLKHAIVQGMETRQGN